MADLITEDFSIYLAAICMKVLFLFHRLFPRGTNLCNWLEM